MKWQELFLQEDDVNSKYWNEVRTLRGEAVKPSYRELFTRDGRIEMFLSLTSPRDIDFSIFPELDFTQKAKDGLASNRKVTEELNAMMAELGECQSPCLEDELIRKGELDAYLENPLFGPKYCP